MPIKKIVLDLETQKLFEEVGGRGKNHLLKVSVCGIWESATDKYTIFSEQELPKLAELLQGADQIIGFNIKDFDFEVLQPYLNFDVHSLPFLDIMQDVQRHLGRRVSLNSIAEATLGKGKSGNGKEAILFWRNNRLDLLRKYCLDDVRITRDVYNYGLANGKILYKDFFEIKEIPVKWTDPEPRVAMQKQISLF
ncbi:MAG: ribonuclease H-like domain-containing protein [Patescibacteria group bacterium]